MLEKYFKLLDEYLVVMGSPEDRDNIVKKMDFVWVKLTKSEKEKCLEYSHKLYLKLIN